MHNFKLYGTWSQHFLFYDGACVELINKMMFTALSFLKLEKLTPMARRTQNGQYVCSIIAQLVP